MAHRRHGSLIHQAEKSFTRIYRPGESRHRHKLAGDALQYIFARETLKCYLRQSATFLRWAQGRGVRNLADLNPTFRG